MCTNPFKDAAFVVDIRNCAWFSPVIDKDKAAVRCSNAEWVFDTMVSVKMSKSYGSF